MHTKGAIKPDHIGLNKFVLQVLGLPNLTVTAISGLSEELDVVDLPDRTVASGGRTGAISCEITIPLHHTEEIAAMEIWLQEGQDPVSPTYKKPATLLLTSISGNVVRSYSFLDMFCAGRTIPDFEIANAGDMAENSYMMRASDILPI